MKVTRSRMAVLRMLFDSPKALSGGDLMRLLSRGPGYVYPALIALEMNELITSWWEAEDPLNPARLPRRRLYKLTSAGIDTYRAEAL